MRAGRAASWVGALHRAALSLTCPRCPLVHPLASRSPPPTPNQAVAAFGNVDVYTSSFRPMRNTIRWAGRQAGMPLACAAVSGGVVHARVAGQSPAASLPPCTPARQTCAPPRAARSGNPGRTFMKLVVAAESQRVVGVHMVGPDSAEIMQGMGVAVKLGVTKPQLDSVVGIHPSGESAHSGGGGRASPRSATRADAACSYPPLPPPACLQLPRSL